MKIWDRITRNFNMQEDYDDYEDEVEERYQEKEIQRAPIQPTPQTTPQQTPKVVSMQGRSTPNKMEILNFVMSSYEMTGEVSKYIKDGKPVIVNMQQLAPSEVQRALDFLTGACHALNGKTEKIAEHIFLFVPEDVHITPDQMKTKNSWPNM